MRRMTTIKETRRPTPENSAIETNCAVSEFCDADEEMPAVFGMTALPFLVVEKHLSVKCRTTKAGVQCAFWLSANPPQVQEPAGNR
jgi:hypothetical protein